MKNKYEFRNDYVVIYLPRKDDDSLELMCERHDFERANEFPGTWYAYPDYTKYGLYLCFGNMPMTRGIRGNRVNFTRWITNCRPDLQTYFFTKDYLDCRRSNFRMVTRSTLRNLQIAARKEKQLVKI